MTLIYPEDIFLKKLERKAEQQQERHTFFLQGIAERFERFGYMYAHRIRRYGEAGRNLFVGQKFLSRQPEGSLLSGWQGGHRFFQYFPQLPASYFIIGTVFTHGHLPGPEKSDIIFPGEFP